MITGPEIDLISSELLINNTSLFQGDPTPIARTIVGNDPDAFWNTLEPTWSFLASDTITFRVGTDTSQKNTVYPVDTITLRVGAYLGWLPTLTYIGEKTETRRYYDGLHEISFCPSSSSGFRRRIDGSRVRNEPLWITFEYSWTLKIPPNVPVIGTFVAPAPPSSTDVFKFIDAFGRAFVRQDEIDCWRQEYEDFGAASVPTRSDWMPLTVPVNRGNYSGGLDTGIAQRVAAVEAAFRNRPVIEAPVHSLNDIFKLNGGLVGNPLLSLGESVFIAPTSTIDVESGYRNPRRNVDVGSKFPVSSKHVWGRAIDIVPGVVSGVTASGRQVKLQLHEHVYPTLLQAARSVESASIGEDGAVQVVIGSMFEDHIHMQW